MKTSCVFLFLLALISTGANAQKGSWYAGGNFGLNSSESKTETGSVDIDGAKNTTFSFSPEVGTFLTDHVQLGIGFTVTGSKVDYRSTPNSITKSNTYGATLYSRYFFGKEAFKPFVGVNVSALPGNQKTTQGNTTNKSDVFNFGANLNAGFGYALSKHVTAVGSFGFVGFNQTTTKPDGGNFKTKTSSFGIDAGSLGNRFNVGFYYGF